MRGSFQLPFAVQSVHRRRFVVLLSYSVLAKLLLRTLVGTPIASFRVGLPVSIPLPSVPSLLPHPPFSSFRFDLCHNVAIRRFNSWSFFYLCIQYSVIHIEFKALPSSRIYFPSTPFSLDLTIRRTTGCVIRASQQHILRATASLQHSESPAHLIVTDSKQQ